MTLKINDNLDVAALADAYQQAKRLQVHDILMPESAEQVFSCLANDTPWGLVYNNGKDVIELSNEAAGKLSPEDMKDIYRGVYARAKDQYQFIYHYYPILTSYKSGQNREFFLHRVLEFLNSEPVLAFMREFTGISEIIKADAQATWFRPNNFLGLHHDEDVDAGRRCAYVLNLTRTWQPNWGGYLQFFDDKDNVETALMPLFNVLNVFTVPQPHAVEYVPPQCGGNRFAITGWFRDR